MTSPDINLLTMAAATLFGGAVTYLVNRFGKSADARGQAEAALMGIGPAIIQEQNKRIAQLEEQITTLWARDLECRNALAAANQRILVLEHKADGFP